MTNQPTISITILTARQRVAALKKELESTSPAHETGTYWRTSRQEELALIDARLTRLEQLEAAMP